MGHGLGAATFLKADRLTSHRGRPTREAGGGGRCQLRSALTLAQSLAAFELPSTGPQLLGCYSLGKLEAQQECSNPSLLTPQPLLRYPLWQPLLQAFRPTAERSPLPVQPIALFHVTTLCFGVMQRRCLTWAADLDSSQKASCLPPCNSGSDF